MRGKCLCAANPKLGGRRRIDDAGPWRAIVDQSEIDRELAIARKEFAGAVERIDENKSATGRKARARGRRLSETTGICGKRAARPLRMTVSAAISASQTGLSSAFTRAFASPA